MPIKAQALRLAVGLFARAQPCERFRAYRNGKPIAHGVGSHKDNKAIAWVDVCRSPPLWAISGIPPTQAIAHGVGSYEEKAHTLVGCGLCRG